MDSEHSVRMVAIGKKLREAARLRGLADAEIARRAGISSERYGNYVRDKRQADYKTLMTICRVLNVSPNYLFGLAEDPVTLDPSALSSNVSEVDVRADNGRGERIALFPYDDDDLTVMGAVRGKWSFPDIYLRHELQIYPQFMRILEVLGDSMEPTLYSGDRIMVDISQCCPSPPGLFALWDDVYIKIRHIEPVPNSDPPRLRIKSGNVVREVLECTTEEVRIIGRVIWFARRI